MNSEHLPLSSWLFPSPVIRRVLFATAQFGLDFLGQKSEFLILFVPDLPPHPVTSVRPTKRSHACEHGKLGHAWEI